MARNIGAISVAGALVCLLLMSSCSSTTSTPNLRRLALRLSDFPRATILDSARAWTDRQAASRDRVAPGLYERHHRLRSYGISVERHVMNGSEPTWLLRADNEVTAYRDIAGARWGYRLLVHMLRRGFVWGATTLGTRSGEAAVRVPYRPLPVPPIGDSDAAFTVDHGGDEYAYTTRVLVFRRDRYVVFLRVTGLVESVAVSRVVALGRIVDRRISENSSASAEPMLPGYQVA